MIQVTENGGERNGKINIKNIIGLPKESYVNDIKADLFNENIVYVVFDNHKNGDFSPYLYKAENKGNHGKNIHITSRKHYFMEDN